MHTITRTILVLATLMTFLPLVRGQEQTDDRLFRDLVARLEKGETEEVKRDLPSLISKYQNHPGLLYLQARLASDGIEAAKLYQSILDNYPKSEWADDALFHLQQYYYAMGLYKSAELKMQQLRKEYPESEYLKERKTPPAVVDSAYVPPPAVSRTDTADTVAPARATPPEAERTEIPDTSRPDRTEAPAGGETAPPTRSGSYALQTGAFSTAENAFTQKSFFEQRGYTVEVTNRVRGGRSLYLVWVGNYETREEARAGIQEIRSRYNITPIIVER